MNYLLLNAVIESMTKEEMAKAWNEYDFETAEKNLDKIQHELGRAAHARDMEKIYYLSNKITGSFPYKMLAVRKVALQAKNPGVDNIMWRTAESRLRAAADLNANGYEASPLCDVKLTMRNGKERIIGIPTMKDRAMQTLYGFALVPVVDTWGDKRSYAFRAGRSLQDAITAVSDILNGEGKARYLVQTDIKSFYASIHQEWLIQHTPMDKKMLRSFLRCGHILPGELFPEVVDGISLGCPLSPYLGNFILDGLQFYIRCRLDTNNGDYVDYDNGNMVRYADDVLVTARTPEDAEKIVRIIEDFYRERGLILNYEKTRIIDLYKDSFTFLSCTYRKMKTQMYVCPEDDAVERFKDSLKDFIDSSNTSQRRLIMDLNKRLMGWASLYRYTDAYDAFKKIDDAVEGFLFDYIDRRYKKGKKRGLTNKEIEERFWYVSSPHRRVFALENDKSVYVKKLVDVRLMKHISVAVGKHYYVDADYFDAREDEKDKRNINGKYNSIFRRQEGCCAFCGRPIVPGQEKEVVPLDLRKKASIKNSQYIHSICGHNKVIRRFVNVDIDYISEHDIIEILTRILKKGLSEDRREKGLFSKKWRHYLLKEYLSRQNEASVKLTFADIEKIEKQPLSKAYYNRSYWYPREYTNSIADAWLTEGYKLETIDTKKKYIKLKRTFSNMSRPSIPTWLSNGKRLPDDARNELDKYLKYLGEKYAL